ncbi:MAG TPA: glutamate-cysteine ligase family protein [Pyrinomonadaceae bacterium]|nr:glutamate-cysteine ligase family protein [Pyrinomonadaceae bacterium]
MVQDETIESQESCAEPTVAAAREVFPLLTDPVGEGSAPLFVENLRRGAKPRADWMCGVELELFGYDQRRDYERLRPPQVERVLAGFAPSSNDLVYDGNVLIEVDAGQMNRLTIEPGGQVEFSGAPQRSLADVESEIRRYLARLREIAEGDCLAFLAVGFDPFRTLTEQHWFPKARYEVMRPYLGRRGARAWDMMTRTCAAQTNLDYGRAEDLAQKFQLGNRLAPIVTAIFANSPFEDGQASGYKSTRAAVWLDTDPDRTGVSPAALAEVFSPDEFVRYALDVPMIFAQRGGRYLSGPTGMKFGEFLARGCDRVEPVFGDWADHLTTIFTEARLKQHVELRSADSGNLKMTLALQALWKGLMYDETALAEALRLAPALAPEGMRALQERVARDGLEARFENVNVLGLAKEVVRLARGGLERTALEEVVYLDILFEQVVEDEVCPADILLRNWHGSWHHSRKRVAEYLRIA